MMSRRTRTLADGRGWGVTDWDEREDGAVSAFKWAGMIERVSVESAGPGMEWHSMAWGSWHKATRHTSPLRQEGGYHRGERAVRKLRKATRSETTRAIQ